jgi:hypothetical protein
MRIFFAAPGSLFFLWPANDMRWRSEGHSTLPPNLCQPWLWWPWDVIEYGGQARCFPALGLPKGDFPRELTVEGLVEFRDISLEGGKGRFVFGKNPQAGLVFGKKNNPQPPLKIFLDERHLFGVANDDIGCCPEFRKNLFTALKSDV